MELNNSPQKNLTYWGLKFWSTDFDLFFADWLGVLIFDVLIFGRLTPPHIFNVILLVSIISDVNIFDYNICEVNIFDVNMIYVNIFDVNIFEVVVREQFRTPEWEL